MRYYEDMQHTSENRLPPRAHYIPGGAAQYVLLNGDWRFAFFPNGDAATEPESWDSIPVPGCWQLYGYEYPNYTNVNYPICVDVPYVPSINPMGIYEREFTVPADELSTYLMLEGVSSMGEVYVNGRYVGFTQGSHLQAEFDLTDYVVPGTNTLRVNVRKWCVGTYLEDQDFLRYNGLFRDVYLLRRPKAHLRDFEIITDTTSVKLRTDCAADVVILDGDKEIFRGKCEDNLTITIPEPKLWNAETPYLYTMILSCNGEEITQKFGLRTIALSKKRELLINGVPVKLKGVNHHDTTPDGGWVITNEQIKKDLTLMKQLHMNTIRTSHYPPSPYLTEVANELGFYVVLETDIESHGFVQRNPNTPYGYDVESPDWPGNYPEWKAEHLERMERALERFKNQTSIFMWSTGNESGHCTNHAAMLDYIHARDPYRLAHCEDESRKGSRERADVFSGMYWSMERLQELVDDPEMNRPLFLCEYAHAMGNGPGDVWDYWEFFLAHPECIGGCIWEWVDHAIYYGGKLCYGGDFPEEKTHDGNFCCDGMLFADRTFKPGTMEIAATYAPLRASWCDGKIEILNIYDFTSFENYTVRCQMMVDGNCTKQADYKLALAPKQTCLIDLPEALPASCALGAFADVSLLDAEGNVVCAKQVDLPVPVKAECSTCAQGASLQETAADITVQGEGFAYTISKQTGNLVSAIVNGAEQLAAPVTMSAYRAPTDNEKRMVPLWTRENGWQGENLEYTFNNIHDILIKDGKIFMEGVLGGVSRRPYFRYALEMDIRADGTICYTLDGKIAENATWLPRLGFEFTLAQQNVPFSYFGMGPLECYCDTHHHTRVDRYTSSAEAEFVRYIVPQEQGNHIRTRELTVNNALQFIGDNFDFQVNPYSTHQLHKAMHIEELPQSNVSHLRIDYKNSGIGSGSCGPDLLEKYRFSEKDIHFSFCMKPVL